MKNSIVINGVEVSPETRDILLAVARAGRLHAKEQYLLGLLHGAIAASVGALLWYFYGGL
jgi:hypothetical protein